MPVKPKSPVAANHPAYEDMKNQWTRCRDAIAGSRVVKEKRECYLPRLAAHNSFVYSDAEDRYSGYLNRALFYNASRRTKMGLSGAATAKPPKIVTSDPKHEKMAKVVTSTLRDKVIAEQLETSFCAVVVDQPEDQTTPSPTLWWAENVVNWRISRKNDEPVLTLLVLEEDLATAINDFEDEIITTRHVYKMEADVCMYERWQLLTPEGTSEETWMLTIEPKPILMTGGRTMDFIPAKLVSATELNPAEPEDPILSDLVDVNFSHYLNSADLEHGRHWCALPTAWGSGFPVKDDEGNEREFPIGGEAAWMTEVTGATAGYLEFSGSGLGHLSEGMKDKQAMMAVLGARLLEEAKPSVESSETIKTRMSGERSVLALVASTCSNVMTWTLRTMILWTKPYEVDEKSDLIQLNTDFVDTKLTSADIASLTAALQADAISYATYFYCLQRGEIIPEERTMEQEIALIEEGNPVMKTSDADPQNQDRHDADVRSDDPGYVPVPPGPDPEDPPPVGETKK